MASQEQPGTPIDAAPATLAQALQLAALSDVPSIAPVPSQQQDAAGGTASESGGDGQPLAKCPRIGAAPSAPTVTDPVRQAFVVGGAALIALGELMQLCVDPTHLTTLPFHPTYYRVHYGVYFEMVSKRRTKVDAFLCRNFGEEKTGHRACYFCPHPRNQWPNEHKSRNALIKHIRDEHPAQFTRLREEYMDVSGGRVHEEEWVHTMLTQTTSVGSPNVAAPIELTEASVNAIADAVVQRQAMCRCSCTCCMKTNRTPVYRVDFVVDLSDEQSPSGASAAADSPHSNQDRQSVSPPTPTNIPVEEPSTSAAQRQTLTQAEVDRVVRMALDGLIGEKPYAYAEAFLWIQIAIHRIWAEFRRSGIRIKHVTTVRLRRKGQDSEHHFVSDSNLDLAFCSKWENNAMEVDVRIYTNSKQSPIRNKRRLLQ